MIFSWTNNCLLKFSAASSNPDYQFGTDTAHYNQIILNENPSFEMEQGGWLLLKLCWMKSFLCVYQPELFETDPEKFVCRLKKSLYGLKQSAKNWSDMLSDIPRLRIFSTFF